MSDGNSGPALGTVLGGKYRIVDEIGRGGMAVIFAAENVDIGKQVAVKVLASELATSRTITERFLREARAAAKIRSPYICEVYDVGTFGERPFIVMELLNGESLYEWLARERRLSLADAFRVTEQTARGLAKAHAQNIVHRDLKPENIFVITAEDGQPHTKLVDFGLAKFYEPNQEAGNARLTKEGALFGTPAYMSPEQAGGKGNVDFRSDLWALGCIVFEMLTGRTVWNVNQGVPMILAQIATAKPPQPRKYRPDLPVTFDAWFERALARDPDARFQTTSEFVSSLARALGFADPTAGPGRPIPTPISDNPSNPFAGGQQTPWAAVPLPSQPGADSHPSAPAAPNEADGDPGRRASGRWLLAALGACVVLGAAVLWASAAGDASVSRLTRSLGFGGPKPVDTAAYAVEVGEAQVQLSEGNSQGALRSFREAFEASKGKAARSLHAHVEAALDAPAGRCRLKAVGHPRPFESTTESSALGMVKTPQGLLTNWADGDAKNKRIHAYTALLDGALRRITPPINVTPEATHARDPQLRPLGEKVALLYWDFAGDEPGVYTRVLTSQGHIEGAPHRVGNKYPRHPYYPDMSPDGAGNYWIAWVEPSRDRVHDLFVQKLGPNLEPLSKARAVTGYPTPSHGKTQVAKPAIGVLDGIVHIAFTLRRGQARQMLLLRASPETLLSAGDATPASPTARPAPGDQEFDRFVGQVISLSETPGHHDQARIACPADSCLVAWEETKEAALLAKVDAHGKVVWRRRIAEGGARPGLGANATGTVAAWFSDRALMVAPLTNGNPMAPAVVGRVSAVMKQPPPTLLPAEDPGEWYIAWRGYEAAVEEPFVARIGCQ